MSVSVESAKAMGAESANAVPPRTLAPMPVTVIEPRRGWRLLDLRELWRGRELLFFLVWRDIKIRYKQTIIGAAWAVFQPLAMVAGMTFALGRIAGDAQAEVPYWLFVLTGMLPWLFFTSAVTLSANSVVNNQQLITRVYFPRMLLPLSAIGLAMLDFAVGSLVLLIGLPVAEVKPTATLLLAPLPMAVLLTAALGLGLALAALTVRYRDFRVILPLVIQLGMFLTPGIFLQSARFGPVGETVLLLNPVQGAVVNFRAALLGLPMDWSALGIAATEAILLLLVGSAYFRRAETSFADVI